MCDLTADSSLLSTSTVPDQRCWSSSKTRIKNWQQHSSSVGSFNQSLSRGISFELESASLVPTVDEPAGTLGHRRSSLLQSTAGRRGSALQGQTLDSSSSSSSSSSERRRSSCLSDLSVRSGSSKRSSTGDFSSELDEYFDNVGHRSLQTAVIEEEATHELATAHDAGVCLHAASAMPTNRRMLTMTGQNLLEHFVDNLINEAAQQSKVAIEERLMQPSAAVESVCVSWGVSLLECSQQLEEFASQLADDIVTGALEDTAVKEEELKRSVDSTRPCRPHGLQRQATEQQRQQGRRFERQQTVSGFRDAVLSDFDNKLMSSNIVADPVVTFPNTVDQKRRSSEPASLDYSRNSRSSHRATSPVSSSSSTSSVDYREIISGWFNGPKKPAECLTVDVLSDYVQGLVLDAFVESVSPSSTAVQCHKRHRRRQKSSSSPLAVSDAILSYADHLSNCVLQEAQLELRTSAVFSQQTCIQSVAENFARSIVDDALGQQSRSLAAAQHMVVSSSWNKTVRHGEHTIFVIYFDRAAE